MAVPMFYSVYYMVSDEKSKPAYRTQKTTFSELK